MSERFYVLQIPMAKPFEASTDYFTTNDTVHGDATHCERCKKPLTMLSWLPPFKVELKCWGRHHADIAFGGPDLLVSKAFRFAFRREGLVGLEFPGLAQVVKVVPKRMTESTPRYYLGRIKRASAAFDDIASGAKYERPWSCPECKVGYSLLRFKRLSIEAGTWEGEDIFYLKRLGVADKMVSERFKEFCERYKFKGVLFIPAEEFSSDYYRGEA